VRRVLVSLDGSDLAASILPDAQRLAGAGGTVILIRTASRDSERHLCRRYLEDIAGQLAPYHVETHVLPPSDQAVSIDRATAHFGADMIALATRGRDLAELWQHGSVAWRAALRSTVPVLLRHSGVPTPPSGPSGRRILVPLDGSVLAERALPLAAELAREWDAALWLVRVVAVDDPLVESAGDTPAEAESYVRQAAEQLGGNVGGEVRVGLVVDSIVAAADELSVTDVVMTTHGRSGRSRILIGGVAQELVHRLGCPILVIPALASLPADPALV
jgi:nucleotide-binding universal stress UspA family protein